MNNDIYNNLDEMNVLLSKLSNSIKYLESIDSGVKEINTTCLELINTLNGLNEVSSNSLLSDTGNILDIGASILSINASLSATGGIIGTLGKALSVVPGPIGILVGSFTGLLALVAVFGESEATAAEKTRLFNEAQEAKRNELIETSKALNESTASAINNAKNAEIQSEVLKGFVGNLRGLSDENGFVKNFEQAQYYVDQINSAMPGTVKLTEEGKLSWLQNAEAIDENIKQLERKAKVDAYYEGYVESLKKETKLRSELTLAQNNYNSELEKQQGYQDSINELMAISGERTLTSSETEVLTAYVQKLGESNATLDQYSLTLDKAKGAYEANAKGAELYHGALGSLDGGIAASAVLQAEEYTKLEEDGTSTWDSLAAASEDCKNRISTAQGQELETFKATSLLLKDEMVNKALSQGMTYNDMIKQLEEKGVQLNDVEKSQLQNRFNLWDMNSTQIKSIEAKGLDTLKLMRITSLSQMNDDEKVKLADSVKQFAESGDKSGIELCNKLATSLEANNGVVDEETQGILDDISKRTADLKAKAKIGVDGPTKSEMDTVNQSAKNGLSKQNIGIGMKPTQKGFTILGHSFSLDWWPFAEGGFPPIGELFVAREAGPELVGRINGKTAVANNDQIVSGISSGVYNAVRSAMAGNGGNGNMNIHATFVMDGDVVGKQVIKYHNGVVKRTGTTPLMI